MLLSIYIFFTFQIILIVLVDQYNPRLVKELLQDLNSTLYDLTVHIGPCVLVGNVNVWSCRLETILRWQQQLNNLQIPEVEDLLVFVCSHSNPDVNMTFKKRKVSAYCS